MFPVFYVFLFLASVDAYFIESVIALDGFVKMEKAEYLCMT